MLLLTILHFKKSINCFSHCRNTQRLICLQCDVKHDQLAQLRSHLNDPQLSKESAFDLKRICSRRYFFNPIGLFPAECSGIFVKTRQ